MLYKYKRIAKKVRNACYDFAHSEDSKDYDFFVYSYGVYDAGLGGMCAVASWILRNELRAAGYKAKVKRGYYKVDEETHICHCWVEMDNRIIDITATQFGTDISDVVVTDLSDENYFDGKEIQHLGMFREWPITQRPEEDVINDIKRIISGEYKPEKIDLELYDSGQVELLYRPTYGSLFACW